MTEAPHTDLQQQQQKQLDEDEAAELEMLSQPRTRTLYDKVHEQAEKFATTYVGQFVIERLDRALKVIEDTAKWSLPQDKTEKIPLERPLTWLPFLSMIIMLRVARIWLSIGALLIGNSPVSPGDVVYFIQTRRRKLRAIRVHGLKTIRKREQEEQAMRSGGNTNLGFVSKLRSLLSLAICRPGLHYAETSSHVYMYSSHICEEKKKPTETPNTKKRLHELDVVDRNLSLHELLAKYANENSEDDSDFIPDADDETSDASTSESESSNDSNADLENGNDDDRTTIIDAEHNYSQNQIKENGNKHRGLPKPIIEIKKEPISDIDSGTELHQKDKQPQSTHNGGGVGGRSAKETDFATNLNSTTPNEIASETPDDPGKSITPGHSNAALFNTTAAAVTDADAHNNRNENVFISVPITDPVTVNVNVTDNDNDNDNITTNQINNIKNVNNKSLNEVCQNQNDITTNEFEVNEEHTINMRPTLGRLDCSPLTPATSTEDIYYSPIGSPTEFNAFHLPASILKNSTVHAAVETNVPTTVSSEYENKTENSEIDSMPKKHVTLPQQQQQQHTSNNNNNNNNQRQHHNNRYRGRNRR